MFKLINNNATLKNMIEGNDVLTMDFLEIILNDFYDYEGDFVDEGVKVLKRYLDKDKAYDKVDYDYALWYSGSYRGKYELLEYFGVDIEETYDYGGDEEVNMEADRCYTALVLMEEISDLIKDIEVLR